MNELKKESLTIAVTSYFNPLNYQSRKDNYLLFKNQLQIPLLTIEWSPEGKFDLTAQDADFLIQLSSGDLMWQKERLLNIAFFQIPSHFKYIAWLDSDIIFLNKDWLKKSEILLQDNYIIQPFSEVFYLDKKTRKELSQNRERAVDTSQLNCTELRSRYSFVHQYKNLGNKILEDDLNLRFNVKSSDKLFHQPAYGFAWVARKDFINQYQLYDRSILGGSDILLAYALVDGVKILKEKYESVGWGFYCNSQSFTSWHENISHATNGKLSFAQGSLIHLFHGELQNRQYISRINDALKYHLNLDQDIVYTQQKLWKFTKQELKDSFSDYFYSYLKLRQED
jgi:hypothetical protein